MEQSVVRTVAMGTFWVSSATLALKLVSIVTVFLILTKLSAQSYGILELSLSITSLLGIFLLPGLDLLVTAEMGIEIGRQQSARARAIAQAYVSVQVVLALVACAIIFFGASFLAAAYNIPALYVRLVAFLFIVSPLRSLYGIVFRVNLNFLIQSLLSFIEEVAKLSLLALFFFAGYSGVAAVLTAILLSQWVPLILLLPWFVRVWTSYTLGQRGDPLLWRSFVMGNNAWGIVSSYTGNFGRSARLWVIEHTLGPEAVGLYAVASGLMGHTTALVPIGTIISPILPRFVTDPPHFAKLFVKSVKYQLVAYVAIGIVAFIAFPPILSIIFPKYIGAFPLFRIMLIGLIPGAAIAIITPAFFALKLQKNLFYSLTLKAMLSVIFTYAGAILFGLPGLAFESILTSIIQTFERMRYLRRRIPEIDSYKDFVSIDEDDRMLLEKFKGAALAKLQWVGSFIGVPRVG